VLVLLMLYVRHAGREEALAATPVGRQEA
jgi:hypothetical protein